jgi:hypothetical protein
VAEPLVYNLGNLCRRLRLPALIEKWSLTSLQQRLVKTVGRLIPHARYYRSQLDDGHLTLRLNQALKKEIPVQDSRYVIPLDIAQIYIDELLQ